MIGLARFLCYALGVLCIAVGGLTVAEAWRTGSAAAFGVGFTAGLAMVFAAAPLIALGAMIDILCDIRDGKRMARRKPEPKSGAFDHMRAG